MIKLNIRLLSTIQPKIEIMSAVFTKLTTEMKNDIENADTSRLSGKDLKIWDKWKTIVFQKGSIHVEKTPVPAWFNFQVACNGVSIGFGKDKCATDYLVNSSGKKDEKARHDQKVPDQKVLVQDVSVPPASARGGHGGNGRGGHGNRRGGRGGHGHGGHAGAPAPAAAPAAAAPAAASAAALSAALSEDGRLRMAKVVEERKVFAATNAQLMEEGLPPMSWNDFISVPSPVVFPVPPVVFPSPSPDERDSKEGDSFEQQAMDMLIQRNEKLANDISNMEQMLLYMMEDSNSTDAQ